MWHTNAAQAPCIFFTCCDSLCDNFFIILCIVLNQEQDRCGIQKCLLSVSRAFVLTLESFPKHVISSSPTRQAAILHIICGYFAVMKIRPINIQRTSIPYQQCAPYFTNRRRMGRMCCSCSHILNSLRPWLEINERCLLEGRQCIMHINIITFSPSPPCFGVRIVRQIDRQDWKNAGSQIKKPGGIAGEKLKYERYVSQSNRIRKVRGC